MNFSYLQAKDLSEAIGLLKKFSGDAKIIAGGTELLVNMRHHALSPKYLIDIKSIPGLSSLRYDKEGTLTIGALTALREIERFAEIKENHLILAQAAQSIATMQIKNMGTLGGNLVQTVKCPFYNQSHVNLFMRQSLVPCRQRGGRVCHAARVDTLNHSIIGEPVDGCLAPTASDFSTPLIALGASVKVFGPSGERTIPAESFFIGGGHTALQNYEILSAVQIPPMGSGARSQYQKYAQDIRNFSIINLAVILWLTSAKVVRDLRIVLGGMGSIPLRLNFLEDKVKGQNISALNLQPILQNEWAGVHLRGELTAFKLRKAKVMISDALERLLQGDGTGGPGGTKKY